MERFQAFVDDHLLTLIILIIVVYITHRFAMIVIHRLIQNALKPDRFKTKRDEQLRKETLTSVVGTITKIGIIIVAILVFLAEIGVNITPMLASAGIVGVALGFGGQSLVKDYLGGLFILLENQYRVGDVVQINQDISGVVEQITMRATTLRNLDGMVHHIPNGVINTSTNMTMEHSKINLDIGVAYDTDIDKVEKIINEVGVELANDENWEEKIIDAPTFLRINEFADSAIIIKIVGKTVPMAQWGATGELRRRLKKAFDKNNIEIPFPQRTIHQAKTTSSK